MAAPHWYLAVCTGADAVFTAAAYTAVFTDAGPAACLTGVASSPMMADGAHTALFAGVAHATMHTNAAPAAQLAVVALPAMLADAAPTAIFADGATATMLAYAGPAACLARAALAAVFAYAGPTALFAAPPLAAMWTGATLGCTHNTHRSSGVTWRRPQALHARHHCGCCYGGDSGGSASAGGGSGTSGGRGGYSIMLLTCSVRAGSSRTGTIATRHRHQRIDRCWRGC